MSKNKKSNKITPTTLKPIRHNVGIERKYTKKLKEFSRAVNNSCKWWLLSKIRKYEQKDFFNISKTLHIEFNRLLKFWNEKAETFADNISQRINKDIIRYANSQFLEQGFEFKKTPREVQQTIAGNIFQNMGLIKTIPQEIIERYQATLYNQINSFDLEAIEKSIKTISKVSERRAKIIARDQVSKALENYSTARSQSLGFEYYVWNTAHDERVSKGRGGHTFLEGRIYRYDNPTAIIDNYGNKGHTGQRVNCRCVQTPLILQPNEEVKLVRDTSHGDYYIVVAKA